MAFLSTTHFVVKFICFHKHKIRDFNSQSFPTESGSYFLDNTLIYFIDKPIIRMLFKLIMSHCYSFKRFFQTFNYMKFKKFSQILTKKYVLVEMKTILYLGVKCLINVFPSIFYFWMYETWRNKMQVETNI